MVFGWLTGHTPLLCGVVALFGILRVRAATLTMRDYRAWWEEWNAMGGGEMPAPTKAKKRPSKPRLLMRMGICVLVPCAMAGYLPDGQRPSDVECALCLLAMVVFFWSLARLLGFGDITENEGILHPELEARKPDIVEWALPPASSSPSRLEVTRRLTGYAARLLGAGL